MKKIVIIGAGSVGGHIINNLNLYNLNKREIIGFLDDDINKQGELFFDFPILGTISWLENKKDLNVIIGIAFPKTKLEIYKTISNNKFLTFPTLIANNSWVSNNCKVGEGSIIYPGNCINYCSSIGNFAVLNMNCSLGHHVNIDDFTSLAPGVNIGGNCNIGSLVELGIGTSIIQGITIGNNSIVGGQSMVVNNIPENSKVIGVPAKSNKNYH